MNAEVIYVIPCCVLFFVLCYFFCRFIEFLEQFDKPLETSLELQRTFDAQMMKREEERLTNHYRKIQEFRNLEEWKVRYYPRMESPFSEDIAFLHKRRTEKIDRRNLIKLAIKEAYKSGCHGSFDLAEEEARRIHNNIFLNS